MPQLCVLVDGTPLEELPPERVTAIRKRLSEKMREAHQRWVDNNFKAIFEEELRKVRQGK